MVFSSIPFLFYFLPVFLLGYYVSGWRTGALLAGSVAFYVWGEGAYVVLLLGLVALNYAGALWLVRTSRPALRTAILAALVIADFAVLGLFKYAGFLAANLNQMLPGAPFPEIHLKMPLGISFFTFQLVSYLVDVRRGAVAVERNPLKFATYILMFPHLIAGPIVRYADIRDEMHADRRTTGRIGLGVQYFIVGLCQKVLIANSVAPLADHAFGLSTDRLSGVTAWLGVSAYTLQIYFDFCGYSNMAIGLAFMLGFTFPKNFDYPYASQSITEFWRRWHISLSSWFRDYVYIPLGGNRGGRFKTVRNLLIVFFLTGLWHGAAWQFVAWGMLHGAFLMIERFGFGKLLAKAPRLLRHVYVMLAVACAWVLFRADTLPHALAYLQVMATPWRGPQPGVDLWVIADAETLGALGAGVILSAPVVPALLARLKAPRAVDDPALAASDTRLAYVLPTAVLLCGFVLAVALLAGSTLNPFLYFRF